MSSWNAWHKIYDACWNTTDLHKNVHITHFLCSLKVTTVLILLSLYKPILWSILWFNQQFTLWSSFTLETDFPSSWFKTHSFCDHCFSLDIFIHRFQFIFSFQLHFFSPFHIFRPIRHREGRLSSIMLYSSLHPANILTSAVFIMFGFFLYSVSAVTSIYIESRLYISHFFFLILPYWILTQYINSLLMSNLFFPLNCPVRDQCCSYPFVKS